jgi:hypothetical protein
MSYEFIPISIIVIIVYAITYVLYKENVITEALNAKVWAILILITTLILVFIGLILTLFTEYGIYSPITSDLLFWHVEIGIILFIIALFHIHLHWDRLKLITLRI